MEQYDVASDHAESPQVDAERRDGMRRRLTIHESNLTRRHFCGLLVVYCRNSGTTHQVILTECACGPHPPGAVDSWVWEHQARGSTGLVDLTPAVFVNEFHQ